MPSKTPNADCLAHGWDGVAQNRHKAFKAIDPDAIARNADSAY